MTDGDTRTPDPEVLRVGAGLVSQKEKADAKWSHRLLLPNVAASSSLFTHRGSDSQLLCAST